MSINYNILGKPGRDNALYVKVNSGKRYYRLLFDCGESVLSTVDQGDIKSLDYVFFSHCHIDHIAGFDYLFRRIFDRERPVFIYGPEGISKIIYNRLNGFTWNLYSGEGEWVITEICKTEIRTYKIRAAESFSILHPLETIPYNDTILLNNDFEIKAFFLNHSIPSTAYLIKEKETYNVDKEKLSNLGLTPGEWVKKLKDENVTDDEIIYTGGRSWSVLHLKELLLHKKSGDSLAYMTDFLYEHSAESLKHLINCDTIICESQYLDDDRELALMNYHMTSRQAAELAANARAGKLILFHISDRYRGDDHLTMLEEAREIFPNTFYPAEWKI